MSQETCDSCPWDCEYGRAGESRKYLTVDEEGNTLECPARKAYRVLRDEVRRLRGMVDALEFCGHSHSCSGEDCCPYCRAQIKYTIKEGHHVNHRDDCIFTLFCKTAKTQ